MLVLVARKVGLMLLAMLSSTFMLVAIMKYDVKAKNPHYPSFQRFWTSRHVTRELPVLKPVSRVCFVLCPVAPWALGVSLLRGRGRPLAGSSLRRV